MQMPPTQSKIGIRAQEEKKERRKEKRREWRREDQKQLSTPPRSFCAVGQSSVVPNLHTHSPVKDTLDSTQPEKRKTYAGRSDNSPGEATPARPRLH